MGRYININPVQYAPMIDVGLAANQLQYLQQRLDTAEAYKQKTMEDILDRGYVDENAYNQFQQDKDNIFNETANKYKRFGSAPDAIKEGVLNVKRHPWYNLNKQHLEETKRQEEAASRLGSDAIIVNDVTQQPLMKDGKWINPRELKSVVYDAKQLMNVSAILGKNLSESQQIGKYR